LQFAANGEGVIRPTAYVGRGAPDWLKGRGPAVPHGPPHRRKWRGVGQPFRFWCGWKSGGISAPKFAGNPVSLWYSRFKRPVVLMAARWGRFSFCGVQKTAIVEVCANTLFHNFYFLLRGLEGL
jgi:hypothetical protein